MIEKVYLLRIGLSLLLGLFVGWERERNEKNAGLRTIALITFGATLITIFSLKYVNSIESLNVKYDAIRAIAYYLVAIGFVGGGLITRGNQNKLEGITTASLLLPMSISVIMCGTGDFFLAVLSSLVVYIILKLKFFRIKITTKCNKTKHRKKKK